MSILTTLLWTAFLSFLPISELRGGIPFALAKGIPWYWAYPFAAGINILAAPACWIFLSTLHKVFLKMTWYRRLFGCFVERARVKLKEGVEKWGWLGIAAFVAVPLPITGAWTGTLGAWVLGMGKGRTIAAVSLGVLAAGFIVTTVVLLGIRGLHFFIKKI
ncbi:MAG: small multi-drug export protein [Spirochaetaceae bacterium]|jgi:uncharacterized membrane protein|nr:small multi-drug export protein [Spirochaetaceae bacterium]